PAPASHAQRPAPPPPAPARGPRQDCELVPPPHELGHRAPQPEPSALLPREAIDLLRARDSDADRDELEPALQEGSRSRTGRRLLLLDGLQELVEDQPLPALGIRIDVDPAGRAADEHWRHMDTYLDARHPARAHTGTRDPLVDGH